MVFDPTARFNTLIHTLEYLLDDPHSPEVKDFERRYYELNDYKKSLTALNREIDKRIKEIEALRGDKASKAYRLNKE